MSATWYDVLGVDPEATSDEIRDAWKQAIADLEPTDRRFRACNQAAEVLLDPERRAAYDAELAAVAPSQSEPAVEPAVEPELASEPWTEPAPAPTDRGPAWVPSNRLLIGLAALAAIVAVLAAVVQFVVDPPAEDVEDSIREARDAAADAMPVLFTYNYKTAEVDRDQALRRTTGCFHDQLEEVWDEAILPNIEEAKGTATSTLVTTGVVRASDGGDRVDIVVVLDSETSNVAVSNEERQTFTVTMVDEDGDWLVEDVKGDSPFGGDAETESEDCADD